MPFPFSVFFSALCLLMMLMSEPYSLFLRLATAVNGVVKTVMACPLAKVNAIPKANTETK